MPKERLQNLLAELQTELDAANDLDAKTADRLRRAAADISDTLADADKADDDAKSFMDELIEADQRFEVAHPRIADTLRQIMETLSNIGI